MNDNLNKKIYRYGNEYYSIEELYDLYEKSNPNKRKTMKDCLCHFILLEIFKKAGNNKYSSNLESIADIEFKYIEANLSKFEKYLYNKEYNIRLKKLLGIGGIINKYKASELINGEWLLEKIVSLSLGSNYMIDEYNGFSLINYNNLSVDECIVITENFKRNIWNEEFSFYNSPKNLIKK